MNSRSNALADQLHADLVWWASLGDKVAGGAGDALACEGLAQRLHALGYDLQRQSVEVPYFEPAQCELILGSHCAAVYWQAPVVPTEAGGISAPLVVVREVEEAERAHGALALLVLPHGRHASVDSPAVATRLQAVIRAQPRAIVVVPTGPTGGVVGLNAPLPHPVAPCPVAVLAPSDAGPFLQAAGRGESATLVLHGELSLRNSANLLGVCQRGPKWICLSTPRTGWFNCVGERGTGMAAFLAMAQWVQARFPQHSIFLLNSGAHEYRFAGAHHAMALAPAPQDTLVWSHLGASLAVRERLELRGRVIDLPSAEAQRTLMATAPLRAAACEAFAGLAGLEHVIDPLEGVTELGEIVAKGYTHAFAALGISRDFHCRSDDLQVVDGRLLAPVVKAHMAVIEHACEAATTPGGCA